MFYRTESPHFVHPNEETEEPPRTSELVCEISARLIEWRDATGGAQSRKVSQWLSTVVALYRADPRAMWLYLSWQTGNMQEIARSFEDKGTAAALPRQAVQQATAQAMVAIAKVSPELAASMREIYSALIPETDRPRQPGDHSLITV
jgi:hypothetical protein